MILAAIKYNRTVGDKEFVRNNKRSVRAIILISRVLPFIFISGYIVGAVDILDGTVDPVYYFVSSMFFLGAVFIFLLVQILSSMNKALREKNVELQNSLETIDSHNKNLQSEIDRRLDNFMKQDKLLHTVNTVASALLASEPHEFESVLWKSMGMLAESVNVDRVYIWKNHTIEGKLYCTQMYEWSEGAEPQQGSDLTIDIPYDESIPGWEEKLSSGQSVTGLVKNLSQPEQEQLVPQGIISILVVPVFWQNKFWGFVGFDDCHMEREFSEAEDGILRSASLLIANSMLRNEMTQSLMAAREEAISSTKAKGMFLSNMSHEIRTPINAITGMTAIARRSDDLVKIQDCLTKIDSASRQLLALINDILDISKIEANKMVLAAEAFDLRRVITSVENIISVRTSEKMQAFRVTVDKNVPSVLIGDDMRITQVIMNLLSNAVKFTPESGIISLDLKAVSRDDTHCVFEAVVSDTGIGIDAEQQKRLFDAFEQADISTTRHFGGTGLGLSISRSFAELMGGGISVVSTPGEGSSFTFTFRLRVGDYDLIEKSLCQTEIMVYDFSSKTIMLVEDIEINREIICSLLENTGISVINAENGRIACDMFAKAPGLFDMIFMDIQMPVMDGYAATAEIRSLDVANARSVPIIAMTANAFKDDIDRCIETGI